MLISCIWPLHDFGDWSRRWIWLDGPAGVTAIREFDNSSLAVTGLWYVRGNKKMAPTVPIRLELRHEREKLSYKLKVERLGNEDELVESRHGAFVYALGIGSFSGEWIWEHEATGSLEISI